MEYKNIFLVSNSFWSQTFLLNLNYIVNFNVGKVFLMEESHSKFDIKSYENIELVSYDNITSCLNDSDIIFVFESEFFSCDFMKMIRNISVKLNKKLIEFNFDDDFYESKLNDFSMESLKILHLVIGGCAQHYCTEILFNKIFCDNKIIFSQEFSCETRCILCKLYENNLLKEEVSSHIVKSQNTQKESSDLSIHHLSVNGVEQIISDETVERFIRQLAPDYICLSVSSENTEDLSSLITVFGYKYNQRIDCIIKSNFFLAYSNVVYDAKQSLCSDNTLSISKDLKCSLATKIFSSISLPDGIQII